MNNKTIAVNSVIISGEKFISALFSLITTPLILNALGAEDYGIYVLLIGFVGTLNLLNWTLSSSTQRYIAYYLGENNFKKLRKIFISSLFIFFAYGLIFLVLIATLGGYFMKNYLNIPPEKINTANLLIVVISFLTFCEMISIPLIGVFRAHENFLYIAIVGFIQTILKLLFAILLYFIDYNKLLLYSLLMSLISFMVFCFYMYHGIKLYDEIQIKIKHINKTIMREMLSFSGWNFIGALSIIGRNQANQVLLNMFFGVLKNAGYGIAMQINAAMSILSQGIVSAISPRIVKLAGAKNTKNMIYMMRTMSKFAILAVSTVSIPFLFQAPVVLKIWLKNPPEDSVIFSRLIIILGFIMAQSLGINYVFEAIGKVKFYNIWISTILLLNIPVNYVLFLYNYPVYTFLVVSMILEMVSLIVRLVLLKKYLMFSIIEFLNDVFVRITMPIAAISIFVLPLNMIIKNEILKLFITFGIFLSIYPVLVYKVSLDTKQREYFKRLLGPLFKNMKQVFT